MALIYGLFRRLKKRRISYGFVEGIFIASLFLIFFILDFIYSN